MVTHLIFLSSFKRYSTYVNLKNIIIIMKIGKVEGILIQ